MFTFTPGWTNAMILVGWYVQEIRSKIGRRWTKEETNFVMVLGNFDFQLRCLPLNTMLQWKTSDITLLNVFLLHQNKYWKLPGEISRARYVSSFQFPSITNSEFYAIHKNGFVERVTKVYHWIPLSIIFGNGFWNILHEIFSLICCPSGNLLDPWESCVDLFASRTLLIVDLLNGFSVSRFWTGFERIHGLPCEGSSW